MRQGDARDDHEKLHARSCTGVSVCAVVRRCGAWTVAGACCISRRARSANSSLVRKCHLALHAREARFPLGLRC